MTEQPYANPWRDLPITTTTALAAFIGPPDDTFTSHLLFAMVVADERQIEKLRRGFPREVAVFQAWQRANKPPTWLQVEQALAEQAPGV